MQKLILIGGGGHCKACIDVIEQTGYYEILGILDHVEKLGTDVLGYRVIGTDHYLEKYALPNIQFLITIGQIKSATIRLNIFERLVNLKANFATVISPLAYVSAHATIAEGTIIMHQVVVNAAAQIGKNCILNTNSTIEHDAIIENHVHISTNAVINGNCKIGSQVFVGSSATISNQVMIAAQSIIGAGTTVIKNIDEPGTYVGNPAHKIK